MEKTYLDREELIHNRPVMRNPDQPGKEDYNAGWNACVSTFIGIIKEQPAADVAPVVHGKWAHVGGDEWCCSRCGYVVTTESRHEEPRKKYCSDCGARMDGEEGEAGT